MSRDVARVRGGEVALEASAGADSAGAVSGVGSNGVDVKDSPDMAVFCVTAGAEVEIVFARGPGLRDDR